MKLKTAGFILATLLTAAVSFGEEIAGAGGRVIRPGQSIDLLGDVDTTGKANGDCLTWNSSSANWVPGTCGSGSGSSSLNVTVGGTQISSPTASIVFSSGPFTGSQSPTGTATIGLNASSATLQGNTFNEANRLVQLDGSAYVPNSLIDPSSVTKLGNDIALGTETTGNYVASLTEGTGINVGAAGAGATPVVEFDPESVEGDNWWGDGSDAVQTWTWQITGTDPALEFEDDLFDFQSPIEAPTVTATDAYFSDLTVTNAAFSSATVGGLNAAVESETVISSTISYSSGTIQSLYVTTINGDSYPPAGSGGADSLGTHIATKPVDMAGLYAVVNATNVVTSSFTLTGATETINSVPFVRMATTSMPTVPSLMVYTPSAGRLVEQPYAVIEDGMQESSTDTVTGAKTFQSTTTFQALIYDGDLSPGTSGYVLTSRGSGLPPQWLAQSGGGGGGGSGDAVLTATQTWSGENTFSSAVYFSSAVSFSNIGAFDISGASVTFGSTFSLTGLPGAGYLYADANGLVSTAAVSGGGGDGTSVYPATATASFPYGFSASTAAYSGLVEVEMAAGGGNVLALYNTSGFGNVGYLAMYGKNFGGSKTLGPAFGFTSDTLGIYVNSNIMATFNNPGGITFSDNVGLSAGKSLSLKGSGGDTISISAPASGTYFLVLPVNNGDADQVLTTDGSGNLSWTTPSGTGDIEGVTAGDGLTGGGTSGTVELSVDFSSITALGASLDDSEIPDTITVGADGSVDDGALSANVSLLGSLIDIGSETNLAAGRSLTLTDDTVDADAELYTDANTIWLSTPTANDDLKTLWVAPVGITITSISCESDQTVNFDLEIDDGSAAGVNGSDIACTTFATDSSLAGDTTMAAGDRLDLNISSVSGSPTWVSITYTYTKDE